MEKINNPESNSFSSGEGFEKRTTPEPLVTAEAGKEQILVGIKQRLLNELNPDALAALKTHLETATSRPHEADGGSLKNNWSFLYQLCAEDNNPKLTLTDVIDKLPWIVNHDDTLAEEKITLEDLRDLLV